MKKIILPAALLIGTGGVGWLLFKQFSTPGYTPDIITPGTAVPPAAGIKAKYGNFDVFVPADTLNNVLGGIVGLFTKGGTKPKQPTAPDAEAKTDLYLPSAGSQVWVSVKKYWDTMSFESKTLWLNKATEFELVHGYNPLD